MRLSGIKNAKGSALVLMAAFVPLFVAMLAAVIWIGQVAVARAKLQAAADRAAYAGAASLADSLNKIAAANWKIHRAYRDLERDFQMDTQQNRDAASQRFERYAAERDAQMDVIDDIMSVMGGRARDVAADLLRANAPPAEGTYIVEAGVDITADDETQWGNPAYSYVTGPSFVDPENYDGGGYRALKFLTKQRGYGQSVGVFARADITPLILGDLMGGGVTVHASAAAKAFGGSIGDFALKDAGAVDEAEELVYENGVDHLYRAALVPMWTIGAEGTAH